MILYFGLLTSNIPLQLHQVSENDALEFWVYDNSFTYYSVHTHICNKLTFFAYSSISNYAKQIDVHAYLGGNSTLPL